MDKLIGFVLAVIGGILFYFAMVRTSVVFTIATSLWLVFSIIILPRWIPTRKRTVR